MKPAQRKFVKSLIKKWKTKLFLQDWRITFEQARKENPDFNAEIWCDATYMKAVVFIHKSFWLNSKKFQEGIIVHELCHCITDPAYNAHMDQRNDKIVTVESIHELKENLTQRIAIIAFPEVTE